MRRDQRECVPDGLNGTRRYQRVFARAHPQRTDRIGPSINAKFVATTVAIFWYRAHLLRLMTLRER
jgi:hypothetical protein